MEDRNFTNKSKVTKQFLGKNPDIFFTNAYKGNLSVWLKKLTNNIPITRNPFKKLQSSTSNILKRLNDNNFLKYTFHNNLTLTDTVLAKCYGLPKIHKQDTTLRPIISLINSPTHFLVKILYDDSRQYKSREITFKGQFWSQKKKKLADHVVDDDHVLLSLEVFSLFTNVPCDLTLKSLDHRCQLIHNKCRILFDEIINFTKFLFENTYFTFNNNVYLKIFGTPMGLPILPLFADIIMDCLRILKDKHNCSTLFYYWFVDDTILCVQKKFIDLALNIFKSQDNNLQFTFEGQQNNQINFLDLTLIIKESHIVSIWFQKPTLQIDQLVILLIIQFVRKFILFITYLSERYLYLTKRFMTPIWRSLNGCY